MREERRKQETKLLNKLKGIEEEEEEIIEEKPKKTKKKKKSHKFLIYLILILIILISYSTIIEPKYLFKIYEHSIKTNKIDNSMHGLKIVSFSDIHYGTTISEKELDKYITNINKLKPDIIFFTGDLFDKNIKLSKDSLSIIKEKFSKLDATLYKYAIYGENDYPDKELYKEVLTESSFTLLDNQAELLYNESNIPLVIIGINKYDKTNYELINNPIDDIDTSNYYKIVLDHEPDNIKNYLNQHPDLIFTAHSLGGLIRIPPLGGIINNEGAKIYNKKYQKINNIKVFNSFGLGTSNIRIRINNLPSVDLYRLYLD